MTTTACARSKRDVSKIVNELPDAGYGRLRSRPNVTGQGARNPDRCLGSQSAAGGSGALLSGEHGRLSAQILQTAPIQATTRQMVIRPPRHGNRANGGTGIKKTRRSGVNRDAPRESGRQTDKLLPALLTNQSRSHRTVPALFISSPVSGSRFRIIRPLTNIPDKKRRAAQEGKCDASNRRVVTLVLLWVGVRMSERHLPATTGFAPWF